MVSVQLTDGAVRRLYVESDLDIPNLTVQVISMKPVGVVNQPNTPERWRLLISDGTQYITGMLATQLNHMIQSNSIKKCSVLKVPNYSVNVIGQRKVVVLLNVEVLSNEVEKIGSPIACDASDSKPNISSNSNISVLAQISNQNDVKPEIKSGDSKPPLFRPDSNQSKESTKSNSYNSARKPNTTNTTGGGGAPGHIPICGLNPFTNKWKIKARVAQKSEIRHWHNARGEGKLFSVTFLDESGQIKATGFNDTVDHLYERLQEGKVYYVSRGKISIAKKQFNSCNHDYEIMFENATEVEECEDETDTPRIQLSKLTKLGSLSDLEKDSIVDVVAVLKDCGELSEIVGKQTQKTLNKRDITLVDDSLFLTRMTLWGKMAQMFDAPTESIIAFQGVKVGDFGGRTLSMLSSSIMAINPEITEAFDLKGWYDSEGVNAKFQSHTNTAYAGTGSNQPITQDSLKTIVEIKDAQIGMDEKGDYFNCRATIMYIKSETICYPACPTERCNKKLLQDGDDEWRCEKCDKVFPAPDYRYLLQMTVNDHTGTLWLSGFNEVGQTILSINANELSKIQNEDETEYKRIITEATAKIYDFNCRAKQEVYNDVSRVKYSILRAGPVDWVQAGLELAESIVKQFGS
ncbi:replication protein A DNA-binding subunit [Phakopsora pachyrhizi]|uniref:Replication protein A subunit n=1 Tax=Phakopsora pachyrhizi TaxID=170000 RepID=A0AAV0BIH9_PHAPC|nr:replication protein A DNA-binding subunit [Phakopsora pachyrhizi]CAH7687044.1 replication protein A DNA-binding subunit [Phakopsora pachyrhizi]